MQTKTLNWQAYKIAPCQKYHLIGDKPAYEKRFLQVLKFHKPGLAPVLDTSGAYHINPQGEPVYQQRYTRTFGFYLNHAAVNNKEEWFHILPNGERLYHETYAWCGNYQENLCPVQAHSGEFFHIDADGNKLYPESYSYVGDFRDGIAVIQNDKGLHTHIRSDGTYLHQKWFLDLDVFHKNFARAQDEMGWFHIDLSGHSIYNKRFKLVEPFYNGVARIETKDGQLLQIDELGNSINQLRKSTSDPFHEVSGELISYWRFFTLQSALKLELFDYLPSSLEKLSKRTSLPESSCSRLLLALQEMGFVEKAPTQEWTCLEKGAFLQSKHPFSLKQAGLLWSREHYNCWQHLTKSLQADSEIFSKRYQQSWFAYLSSQPENSALYHNVLAIYAKRDYHQFATKIDLKNHQSILDVGGSLGILLMELLQMHPHLQGMLLDLPSVIEQVKLPPFLQKRMSLFPVDFFGKWPKIQTDCALLCRVLHDWPDDKAIDILKKTGATLCKKKSSRLYIIENLLDTERGNGALLDLNMLVMTGGKERSINGFKTLIQRSGLVLDSIEPLNEVTSILSVKT